MGCLSSRLLALLPLFVAAAGCTTAEDPNREPVPALDVRLADADDPPGIAWSELAADMPALVEVGLDRAESSPNRHYVQSITLSEKADIEQTYKAAWAARHNGTAPYPYAVERDGQGFALSFIFSV